LGPDSTRIEREKPVPKHLNRRSFLGLTAAAPLAAQTTKAPAIKSGAPAATYEVIVCGGGNSGLPAAAAAARGGATGKLKDCIKKRGKK